jgi:uncharacterized protein (DUF1697 family)
MPKYIAFLRAINVGGHVVKMQKIRTVFESLGFSDVETFIASGNVIFEAKGRATLSFEKWIEASLKRELGYEVATLIRTDREVLSISRFMPFSMREVESSQMLSVTFLGEELDVESHQQLMSLRSNVDNFHVCNREVYWVSANRFGESKIVTTVSRILGDRSTVRGLKTVKKIAEKYCQNTT